MVLGELGRFPIKFHIKQRILNYWGKIITTKDYRFNGLNYIHDLVYDNLQTEDTVMYFKLYILLYADDTIILAESKHELQAAMNALSHYCKLWKLEVNTSKSKVIVFSKNKTIEDIGCKYNDEYLETVKDFRYLGVDINSKGTFFVAREHLYRQSEKAMYSILRKSRNLKLPVDLQLKLFDSLVLPILLYGAEIWGFENSIKFEKLHTKFCKIILHVSGSSSNIMVLGELGRFPIEYHIKQRILNYWGKIITTKDYRFNKILYQLLFKFEKNNIIKKSSWLLFVKKTLNDCKMYNCWLSQSLNCVNLTLFKNKVKSNLTNYYSNQWKN